MPDVSQTPEYNIVVEVAVGVRAVAPSLLDGADLDTGALTALLQRMLLDEGAEAGTGLFVEIANDEVLHALNRAHRDVDAPTDVLSFAAEEGEEFPSAADEPRYLGDIAISLESVARNAAEAGLPAADELAHVLLHGLLHLMGYDHETEAEEATMRAREEAVLGPAIHASGGAHSDD